VPPSGVVKLVVSPGRPGIILTTYNFLEQTRRCLSSLRRATTTPYLLIAVDANSQDGTPQHLQVQGIPVIRNDEEISLSVALNQGIRFLLSQASVSHIAWIHNDMLFFRGWLEGLLQVLAAHPEVGKLAPYNLTGEPGQYTDEKVETFTTAHAGRLQPGNGCPWIMPRHVVEEVGLFDEGYLRCGGYEDWDYNNRVLERGYQVAITWASAVWHQGMGTRRYVDQKGADRYNAAYYERKWGRGPRV